jgi:UDP-N-acetylglucosamine--dolichyl-phosphate N-acetylglucosaminephosphotransferase
MNIFILTIIIAVISFLITYSILKWYIPYANKNNLTGIDVHKINKPNIANYGGFAIIIGFVISTLISFIFLDSYLISIISLILITIIIVAIIGIYDDLKDLSIIKHDSFRFLSL